MDPDAQAPAEAGGAMMTRLGVAACLQILKRSIEADAPRNELVAMTEMLIGQLELDDTFAYVGECIENDIEIPLH